MYIIYNDIDIILYYNIDNFDHKSDYIDMNYDNDDDDDDDKNN